MFRTLLATCAVLLLLTSALISLPAGESTPKPGKKPRNNAATEVGALRLTEWFGVSHPLQLVEFPLTAALSPASGMLTRNDGQRTPYQVLSGERLVLLTDLPADAAYEWKLTSASATDQDPGKNRKTAKRPTKKAAKDDASATSAWDPVRDVVTLTPSEIGLRVENGVTGVLIGGGNLAPIQGVRHRDGTWSALAPTPLKGATSGQVRVVEKGPLKAVVEVVYGDSYRCTIELQAAQPSILIEDEGTAAVSYDLDLAHGLEPNEGRYHVERGERVVPLQVGAAKTYGRMALWDPWAQQGNRGDGWQLYQRDAGLMANLIALFPGPASRIIQGNSGGPEIFTAPTGASGKPASGIAFRMDGGKRARLPWAIMVGSKGADWRAESDERLFEGAKDDPARIATYIKQHNLHSGINLTKLLRYRLEDYPDPARGYGAMFMSREAMMTTIELLRRDDPFFQRIYGDGYTRPLFDLWRAPTPENISRVTASIFKDANPYPTSAYTTVHGFVNGYGLWNPYFTYWIGGQGMANKALWIDQVLAWGTALTPQERQRLKATAALFAGILWDDDFVPLSTWQVSGLNLGTPNMPIQQSGFRNTYALFLSEHPLMRERLPEIAGMVQGLLRNQINEHGAHLACSHYIGASLWPTLNACLQLNQAGVADLFASEERLRKVAEFYLQLATPPDPRMRDHTGRNLRHLMPIGDSEVLDPLLLCGMLATGFADSDPALAARLKGMWDQSGRPHDSYYGTTVATIDERVPVGDPALGSANFPGYLSVLRSGWGSPHESALWVINGDFYRDHYHNDQGEVVMFAHNAPLSVDFGSMYSPRSAGGMMKSRLLPTTSTWRASPAAVGEEAGNWGRPRSSAFTALGEGGFVTSSFDGYGTQWNRVTSLAQVTPTQPVFVIQDTIGKAQVFSLNLMCEPGVLTPEGERRPGQGFALKPGVNRLTCTGQAFPTHPTGGIDWDLYVLCTSAQEAALSEWSHTNRVPERQVILRIHGDAGFRVVIVPYPKGNRPEVTVSVDGGKPVVSVGGRTTIFEADGSFPWQAPTGGKSDKPGKRQPRTTGTGRKNP